MNSASLIDHMILNELRYAQKLRRDAKQYSRSSLAEKFEMTKSQIDRILEGAETEDPDDARLIHECHDRAINIWQELEFYTRSMIAERYGRTYSQVKRIAKQLERREVAA